MAYQKVERRDLTKLTGPQILKDVRDMLRRGRSDDSISMFLEKVLVARVNVEREEIALAILEMQVEPSEPSITAAASRGGPEGAVKQAVHVARHRAKNIARDRIEELDEL